MAGKRAQAQVMRSEVRRGRLQARPQQRPMGDVAERGLLPLKLGAQRDGFLYVPQGYRADQPLPLVVMLHGAGGHARHALDPWLELADAAGVLLLAPDSRGPTWDLILDDYGPDVAFIDQSLRKVFERYAVDPKRVAIEGFSDGASYALSLGIANGDLFTHVVAFSPGFLAPPEQQGEPRLFISHGTGDRVLLIDRCSQRIVPRMQQAGYEVRYHEFDGPHTVPDDIAHQALEWFTE